MNANANIVQYFCNRPECASRSNSLHNLTRHIRSEHVDDTPFNIKPCHAGEAMGIQLFPDGGEFFLATTKRTKKHGADSFSCSTQLTDNTWGGFLDAYGAAGFVLNLAGNDFLERNCIVLHVSPQVAEIDGVSGSGTVFSSIFSLVTGRLCRSDTAITAWVDQHLQIRGIEELAEKATVASEEDAKIKRLVMSHENQQEWEALPPNTKGEVEGIFVGNVNELIAQVFKPIPPQ
ncbi:hypothetical protein niasHS_016389 [Heterodera schachtii]|uniref:C2H2-type domain-containing protein n=1 Tax=Heterodera schachtii TaxID=97005 RepID=A0ABD2HTQ8_HETSC